MTAVQESGKENCTQSVLTRLFKNSLFSQRDRSQKNLPPATMSATLWGFEGGGELGRPPTEPAQDGQRSPRIIYISVRRIVYYSIGPCPSAKSGFPKNLILQFNFGLFLFWNFVSFLELWIIFGFAFAFQERKKFPKTSLASHGAART